MRWRIVGPDGKERGANRGNLEATLIWLRSECGMDEFTVEAETVNAAQYVPELGDREVPDTIPEDWT